MSDWMMMPSSLCRTFAAILGGTAQVVNGVCTVTRIRSNLHPLIQGRRTNSALSLAALFSFEDVDSRGNALNLGETVILQEEINPFISQLRMRGIEVTALHNHWLFDNPRLMYIHFKSVEPPLVFAQKVAAAFRVLTSSQVFPNRSCGSSGSKGSHGSRGSHGSYGSYSPMFSGSEGCRLCSKSSVKSRMAKKRSVSRSASTSSKTVRKAVKPRLSSASKQVKKRTK